MSGLDEEKVVKERVADDPCGEEAAERCESADGKDEEAPVVRKPLRDDPRRRGPVRNVDKRPG